MKQEEFRSLALKEIDAVYRLAYHLAAQPAEADDLVQETYLHAFRSKTDFQLTEHGLRPYLFKILHNVVHTRASNARRRATTVDDVDQHDSGREPVNPDDRCADLKGLNWDVIDERLKRAIHDLPLPHRTVFLLCAIEGLRYREIADIVDVPLGTVMSRLHRARQTLSAQLVELAAEKRLPSRNLPSSSEPKSEP